MPKANQHSSTAVQVAVTAPVRQVFDYQNREKIRPGCRVLVSFGRRKVVGVVVSNDPPSTARKLKNIERILDQVPCFDTTLLELLLWSSRYYHHPVGEVLSTALPVYLRKPVSQQNPLIERQFDVAEALSREAIDRALSRAPRQRQLFNLIDGYGWISQREISERWDQASSTSLTTLIKALISKQLICFRDSSQDFDLTLSKDHIINLTLDQQSIATDIAAKFGKFSSHVIHGITGSGKTEIYIELSKQSVMKGNQVLVLVPEIALTPQLVERFRRQFGKSVDVAHSGLSDIQRYTLWWRSRHGLISVILGTRSAIFMPLKNPGLIIVDEEHDISFKQRDGFRYHARDMAIKRASIEQVPIVLGSATPSMESMKNADSSVHQLHRLSSRIGMAKLPEVKLVDLRKHKRNEGISHPLMDSVATTLQKGHQSILFINRRGFAPMAQCTICAWRATCKRCDANLTFHSKTRTLRCHHCGHISKSPAKCPSCEERIFYAGTGTQRIESALEAQFPDARLCRFDRDEISTQSNLESALSAVNNGKVDIIIGTQLISKGHDFPSVTLVGIIDPDQGLFSTDFRAPEYLFQQITQVSGRAGRGKQPGMVIIQTSNPDNPYLKIILDQDIDTFYAHCKNERRETGLPPYGYLALWRAESTDVAAGLNFLEEVKTSGQKILRKDKLAGVDIMDPVSSPMERIAGRYRAQLLVKSASRSPLHRLLNPWIKQIESSAMGRKVRWSIDVDPMEMF